MDPHSSITNSQSNSRQTASRRRFAAWLFAGWGAFWFAAVIAPCCNILIANAQAGQDLAAIEYRIPGPSGDGQGDMPCPELSHAQPASSAPAVASFDTTSKAINQPPLPAALALFPAVERVKPHIGYFRPPIPFHQRTARLLI